MSRRGVAVAVLALVGSLLVAAPAQAADSCTFTAATGDVTLSSDAGFSTEGEPSYLLVRRNGTTIEFVRMQYPGPFESPIGCGMIAPTVQNTDSVSISMTHPEFAFVFLSTFNGPFSSSGNTSSIDFSIAQTVPVHGGGIEVGGSNGADHLVAGTGGINLDGDTSPDVAFNGTTQIEFLGGGGNDLLSLNGGNGTGTATTLQVSAYGGNGDDVVRGGTGADLLAGGANNDKVYGGGGADLLGVFSNFFEADPGNDQLFGQGGADMIGGDLGNDILDGGPDEDELWGQAGIDTVTYAAASAAVRASIDGQANDGVGGATEGDIVQNDVENIIGSAYADVLSGRTGTANVRNVLTGGKGGDTLNGLDGSDVLNGGPGANTFNGGSGNDQMNGGADRDVMSGSTGADVGKGGAGNDSINGNDGTDVLYGDIGNDALNGGAQADTCYGGAGTNTLSLCEKP